GTGMDAGKSVGALWRISLAKDGPDTQTRAAPADRFEILADGLVPNLAAFSVRGGGFDFAAFVKSAGCSIQSAGAIASGAGAHCSRFSRRPWGAHYPTGSAQRSGAARVADQHRDAAETRATLHAHA